MQRLAIAPYPTTHAAGECGCSASQATQGALGGEVFDEWHTLLLAVRTRLRAVLDSWPESAASPQQHAAAANSRAMAFECAEALDQLHDTLIDHGHRYRRLAFDLQEARAELAQRTTRP